MKRSLLLPATWLVACATTVTTKAPSAGDLAAAERRVHLREGIQTS